MDQQSQTAVPNRCSRCKEPTANYWYGGAWWCQACIDKHHIPPKAARVSTAVMAFERKCDSAISALRDAEQKATQLAWIVEELDGADVPESVKSGDHNIHQTGALARLRYLINRDREAANGVVAAHSASRSEGFMLGLKYIYNRLVRGEPLGKPERSLETIKQLCADLVLDADLCDQTCTWALNEIRRGVLATPKPEVTA